MHKRIFQYCDLFIGYGVARASGGMAKRKWYRFTGSHVSQRNSILWNFSVGIIIYKVHNTIICFLIQRIVRNVIVFNFLLID